MNQNSETNKKRLDFDKVMLHFKFKFILHVKRLITFNLIVIEKYQEPVNIKKRV